MKYLSRITVTDTLKNIGKGLGSDLPGNRLLLVRGHLRQKTGTVHLFSAGGAYWD